MFDSNTQVDVLGLLNVGNCYGIPTDNYLKTDYKNAVTIIVDDSSNYDYIVFNNYGREVSVKSSNFKIKYYAYEQEDFFIKSYYSNNYIKNGLKYLTMDIKENLVVINGVKQ